MQIKITAKPKLISKEVAKVIDIKTPDNWETMTEAAQKMWIDENVLSMWSVSYYWSCKSLTTKI